MLDTEPSVKTREDQYVETFQSDLSCVVGLRAGRAITMNFKDSSLRGLRFDVFFSFQVAIIIGGT